MKKAATITIRFIVEGKTADEMREYLDDMIQDELTGALEDDLKTLAYIDWMDIRTFDVTDI